MNSHALEMLNSGQIDIAFQILLKCQDLYKRTKYKFDHSLVLLTMNHLACCYKHVGHPKISKRILDDATQLIFQKNISTFRAITYLNRCAVLSVLENHDKAFENARIASECFEREILEMDTDDVEDEQEWKLDFLEKVKLLTICLYNLSIEAEILNKPVECSDAIQLALKLYYFFLEDDRSLKQLYLKLVAHERNINEYMNRHYSPEHPEFEEGTVRELIETLPGDSNKNMHKQGLSRHNSKEQMAENQVKLNLKQAKTNLNSITNLRKSANLRSRGHRKTESTSGLVQGVLRLSRGASPLHSRSNLMGSIHQASTVRTTKAHHTSATKKVQIRESFDLKLKKKLFGELNERKTADTEVKDLKLSSVVYGPSNLIRLQDSRARELQSLSFLTRGHLMMIERYKQKEEEILRAQKQVEFLNEKLDKKKEINWEYQKNKLGTREKTVIFFQKHWKGYKQRKKYAWMRQTSNSKGQLLWRVHKTLSVYRGDFFAGKDSYLTVVRLSPDETYVEIKAKSVMEKKSDWSILTIQVKELIDYFDITKNDDNNLIQESQERARNMRDFTGCFLESLYVQDKILKFNQRKKLQRLIELLNEDSILNIEESEDSKRSHPDLDLSEMSNAELALKKNNYEQYLDAITTRVQKRMRGFLARRRYNELKEQESIKVFQTEINQDGEDILFVLMKRLKSGHFTAHAYNFSMNEYFNSIYVGAPPKETTNWKEPRQIQRIFERIIIDVEKDRNRMYYNDFYLDEGDSDPRLMIAHNEKLKMDRYVELYKLKHLGEFSPEEFRLESRYKLTGKKFVVHSKVPLNVLIFASPNASTVRVDCIRMDTRQYFYSKVYHCLGERLSTFTEGKKLYERFMIKGSVGNPNFEIHYNSSLLEELETDFGERQFELIQSIQKHFKKVKVYESFRINLKEHDYLVEVYVLNTIGKILIKTLEDVHKEEPVIKSNKIYSVIKVSPFQEKEVKMKIKQLITLTFDELHLLEGLEQEQYFRFVKYLTFEKLKPTGDPFEVPEFTREETLEAIKKPTREVFHRKLEKKSLSLILNLNNEGLINPTQNSIIQDLDRSIISKTNSVLSHSQVNKEENESNDLIPDLEWDLNVMSDPESPVELPTPQIMTIEPQIIEKDRINNGQYKFSKMYKNMKPKLFALFSLNSLRKNKKRLTSPVLSSHLSDENKSQQRAESRLGSAERKRRTSAFLEDQIKNVQQSQSRGTVSIKDGSGDSDHPEESKSQFRIRKELPKSIRRSIIEKRMGDDEQKEYQRTGFVVHKKDSVSHMSMSKNSSKKFNIIRKGANNSGNHSRTESQSESQNQVPLRHKVPIELDLEGLDKLKDLPLSKKDDKSIDLEAQNLIKLHSIPGLGEGSSYTEVNSQKQPAFSNRNRPNRHSRSPASENRFKLRGSRKRSNISKKPISEMSDANGNMGRLIRPIKVSKGLNNISSDSAN